MRCNGSSLESCANSSWTLSQNCANGCDSATLACRTAAEAAQQGQQNGTSTDYTWIWIVGILVVIIIIAAAIYFLTIR